MQSEQDGQITLDMAQELVLASDVIFCTTRHHYMPYDDYFTLARLSGYPVIYIDQIPQDGVRNKYFICCPINGEWQHGIKTDGTAILNQLEWHTDRSMLELPRGIAEGWNADAWHARLINARFVPLGSHIGLNLDPSDCPPKEYDIAFMAYTDIYRRKWIKDRLEERGFKVAPNGWGQARHDALVRSRCIVHVHQHDNMPTIAPLRWCLAAAYGLPIISESVNDRRPFADSDFITADYDKLVDTVTMCLHPDFANVLEQHGKNLRDTLTRRLTFRESVERAL